MITEFLSLPLSPGKCSMRYSHSICNALDIVNNPEMTQSIGRNTQLHANSIALDVRTCILQSGHLLGILEWQMSRLMAFVSEFADQRIGHFSCFPVWRCPNNSSSTCQYLSLIQLLKIFLWRTQDREIHKSKAIEPVYILHVYGFLMLHIVLAPTCGQTLIVLWSANWEIESCFHWLSTK